MKVTLVVFVLGLAACCTKLDELEESSCRTSHACCKKCGKSPCCCDEEKPNEPKRLKTR